MWLLLWSACRSTPDPLDCPPIDGADALLAEQQTVLVGELHGTVEAPKFTGDLVCHAVRGGKSVLLALELPANDNEILKKVVEGGEQAALLATPFWSQAERDGRSSQAMLDLIGRAAAIRAAGKTIEVVGFDIERTPGLMPAGRDRSMAESLQAALEAHSGWTTVVLTGNLHARRAPGMPWDPLHRPMADYLGSTGVASVLARAQNGEAWNCQSDGCAVHPFGDPKAATVPPAVRKPAEPVEGYDLEVEFGRFSASPPAVPVKAP